MPPLVSEETVKPRDEIQEDRIPKTIEGEAEKQTFGAMLHARWTRWEDLRRPQEEQWLMNLRQFHSKYEAGIEAQIRPGRSKTFIGITRMKVMAAFASLVEIYFPATGHRHWELKSTPEPTLAISKNKNQPADITTGIPGTPQVQEEKSEAEKANEGMTKRIDDQLTEADYDIMFLNSVLECTILGSGCMKAGSIRIEKDFQWILTEQGWDYVGKESELINPQIEGPSIFDIYPDPNASKIESGIGCFQRHVLNKQEFRNLKRYSWFIEDQIEDYIMQYPKGNHTDLSHEVEIKKLDNKTQSEESLRYDVLEYWGYVDGSDLREIGVGIPDSELSQEFMANVWIAGNTVIKVVLDQSANKRVPFFIFPYERVSNQLWGKGIPEICADSQEILNAAARRLLDDLALSGPQFEVDTEFITPETSRDMDKIFPFKVWGRTGGDSQNPILRITNVQSVSRELIEVISIFRRFMDEELNLPTASSGINEPGSGTHETVGGLRMLMNASNIVMRATVKNIDKYLVKALITKLYMFNMQWSDDEDIKGDMKVNPRGSITLLAKEVQNTLLINALNITNNPTDLQLTKRDNLLRKVFDNQGIEPDEVVKTKEEIDKLSNDPVKQQLDALAIQKSTLENQEVESRIDINQAKREKELAAIRNDEELLRLKRGELRGKLVEAAKRLELEEEKIAHDIKMGDKIKKTAGVKKSTVGATRKQSKNDALQTNNA